MKIKGVTDEDFVNYRKPSMFIVTSFCDYKCNKESGEDCCQNSVLAHAPVMTIDDDILVQRYLNNTITRSIVFGGLEPMAQIREICLFLERFRSVYQCSDDVVLYTGFNKDEVIDDICKLIPYGNIIVKFGRFIPHQKPHYDDVLGVYLASDNQYAERI